MTKELTDFFADKERKRRVLALDGGGVRGMFTIGVLKELEAELRRRFNDPKYLLCNYFDLIVGTSTGSIIATGLALGMSAAEISAYYKTLCPEIFAKPAHDAIAAIHSGRHASGPLTKALHQAFGEETLGSKKLRTGLAVNAMRLDKGSAWIMCNNPKWDFYEDSEKDEKGGAANKRFRLCDLVQASAAAPFYFRGLPLTVATDQTGKLSIEDGFFVDGGVSGNNNPALEALMLVRDRAYGFEWKLGADQLYILNVGTGTLRGAIKAKEMKRKAPWAQARESLSHMISAVSLKDVAVLQAMSRSERRWIINIEKSDQPGAPYLSEDPQFDYQRVDVRLDREAPTDARGAEHASHFLGRPLTEAEAAGLSAIDNKYVPNLMLLDDLGQRVGRAHFSAQNPRPVFDEGRR